MSVVVSREIPGFKGFWANDDGTITKPSGKVTKGSLHKSTGYYRIKINYKSYLVHRLMASAWVKNPRPDIFKFVDHIDGNPHNNLPWNVRYLNIQLNNLNSNGLNCYLDNNRWRAQVRFNGKPIHLGSFKTFLEGFRVGRAYRKKVFETEYNRLVNREDLN